MRLCRTVMAAASPIVAKDHTITTTGNVTMATNAAATTIMTITTDVNAPLIALLLLRLYYCCYYCCD